MAPYVVEQDGWGYHRIGHTLRDWGPVYARSVSRAEEIVRRLNEAGVEPPPAETADPAARPAVVVLDEGAVPVGAGRQAGGAARSPRGRRGR